MTVMAPEVSTAGGVSTRDSSRAGELAIAGVYVAMVCVAVRAMASAVKNASLAEVSYMGAVRATGEAMKNASLEEVSYVGADRSTEVSFWRARISCCVGQVAASGRLPFRRN